MVFSNSRERPHPAPCRSKLCSCPKQPRRSLPAIRPHSPACWPRLPAQPGSLQIDGMTARLPTMLPPSATSRPCARIAVSGLRNPLPRRLQSRISTRRRRSPRRRRIPSRRQRAAKRPAAPSASPTPNRCHSKSAPLPRNSASQPISAPVSSKPNLCVPR